MALPCSCEIPKVKGTPKENQIHICERCGRVICKI
jgi:hypothetical protein